MKNTYNLDLQRAYVHNVPFIHGELTVVTSKNAFATMKHCSQMADTIQKAGASVLLINCGISDKRFKDYHYSTHPVSRVKPYRVIRSSVRGNLIDEQEAIDQIVTEAGVTVVLIAGWEWASSSWRRKEKLMFFLRELMEDRDVAVIIYSHTSNAPVAGEVDRGGIGKLSLMATFIAELQASEELEASAPMPTPVVYENYEEYLAAERSAQLLMNKINDLEGEEPSIGGEKEPVRSGVEKRVNLKGKKIAKN